MQTRVCELQFVHSPYLMSERKEETIKNVRIVCVNAMRDWVIRYHGEKCRQENNLTFDNKGDGYQLHMIVQLEPLQNSSHQPPTVANLASRSISSRVLMDPPALFTLIVYSFGSSPCCGTGYHHLRVCP